MNQERKALREILRFITFDDTSELLIHAGFSDLVELIHDQCARCHLDTDDENKNSAIVPLEQ